VGMQGSFYSQGLWREFSSFAGDLRQAPSKHGGAWLDLGGKESRAKAEPWMLSWMQGIACQGSPGYMHTLQRQRDPTKGRRLWLVLDGIVRAWADCKDG
jgi:hypothetical protein